jgi:hypothetical protein
MASISEAGHAKNLANFEKLISVCTGFGAAYNPSRNAIKLAALSTLATTTRTQLDAVNATLTAHNKAITDRQEAFKPLKTLSTRIVNGLGATEARKQLKEDAAAINKKIQGTSTKSSASAQKAAAAATEGEPAPKTISTSQQSFDSLVEHFAKLVTLLQSEPLYAPNEADIKVAALSTYLGTLRATNKAAKEAENPIEKARIARNKTLYTPDTGLCDIALAVKSYVLSVFKAKSPEYKMVSIIPFRKVE